MIRRVRAWREAELAALDFETTGLDLQHDHVLSFGVVPISGARVLLAGALYRVVKPPLDIPAGSIRVHGLRPSDVADAPPLAEAAGELLRALSGRTIVAHAVWLELAFLRRLPGRGRRRPRAIDVVELARRLAAVEGAPAPPVRLAELAEVYDVPARRPHHALGDALTTAQLFLVLATRLESRGLGRLNDLLVARGGWSTRMRRPS